MRANIRTVRRALTCESMNGFVWKSCEIWKRHDWQGMIPLLQAVWLVQLQGHSLCTVCQGKRWMVRKVNDDKFWLCNPSVKLSSLHLRALIMRGVLPDTHILHWDFLWAWAWVNGSVTKVMIGMFWTHVLSQMIVHLLSLFPVVDIAGHSSLSLLLSDLTSCFLWCDNL